MDNLVTSLLEVLDCWPPEDDGIGLLETKDAEEFDEEEGFNSSLYKSPKIVFNSFPSGGGIGYLPIPNSTNDSPRDQMSDSTL